MGRQQVRCHGDDRRFDAVADLVSREFGSDIRYAADVAGGQGVLSRLLKKRCGIESEVVDPRGHVLRGVSHCQSEFDPAQSGYYDLIIGLHPDQALRSVVLAALQRPTIIVPCCNFWTEHRLSLNEMLDDIARWYDKYGVDARQVSLEFGSPYCRGFITSPPKSLITEPVNLTPEPPRKVASRLEWHPSPALKHARTRG